jgi:predicted Zn-dependent peptidase
MGNVFKGKNYEKIPQGTEESLQKISLESLKNYYTNLLGRKRIFLVVVGNINKEDLKSKVEASFAKLPEGSSPVIEEQTIIVEPTNLIEDRDIATNYIRGYMSAPKMNSKEGVAMMVAMRILSERLFIEIRTKRGLSYAPASFYANGIINSPYNAIYVSTIDPKQSIEVMVNEINKLRKDGFAPKELNDIQQSFLTNHYMGLETMASQSGNLGLAELKGNWKMAEEFANIVNDISLDDINNAIKKYTETISWTYLGKKDMINEGDFLQPVKLLEIPIKY